MGRKTGNVKKFETFKLLLQEGDHILGVRVDIGWGCPFLGYDSMSCQGHTKVMSKLVEQIFTADSSSVSPGDDNED